MSRCFPFPPPGYEKKARTDDVEFLNKEKQEEKSHKKEKKDKEKEKEKKDKDKEKREKKEKKEKDGNDRRHKDKKVKKEKHKDKRKEKGRDKEKEKDRNNNSEEKKFPGHPDGQNGEKISDEKKNSGESEGYSAEKFIQKEKGRDKDLSGESEGYSAEKFIQKEKGQDKDRIRFSGEKKLAGHISGYNGEKIGQNSHLVEDFRDSKFVQELAGRVRDEGAGAGSQFVDKFTGSDWKKDEGMVSFVAKSANKLAEGKEKIKKSDDRKFDVQGIREETRAGGNAIVPNLAGAAKARVEGIPKQVENNAERRGEGKEKIKEKGDDKIRDKRKEKDREKKSHGKDKDREKAKEEKEKAKGEHRYLELDNLKGSNKDDPLSTTVNLKTSNPFKEGGNKGAVAENLRKRKYLENNGFLHVDDVKPNKLPKISSSQPLMGNGRTMESYQAPIPFTLDSKGPGTSVKNESKELKVNDIVKAQLSSVSPTKDSSSTQASQIPKMSIKSPHPDSKYLSQVLSVPKMEEWSHFDDQSWLFHSTEPQSKKPKVGFSEIDEPPQVWAEALQIESADVFALPYVIPY